MEDYGSIGPRAVIYDGEKLFVVTNKWVPGYFVLPGGGMDPGESVTKALEREIMEELGIKAEVGALMAIHQIKQADDTFMAPSFIFHVTNHQDFKNIDLSQTTHGEEEIDEFKFTDDYSLVLPQEIIPLLKNIEDNEYNAPGINLISPEIDQK